MENKEKYIERFEENIIKGIGCWLWHGKKLKHGYGSFHIKGITTSAHRSSYILYKGEIPKGFQVDHLCRNPPCVNPEHLEAVTREENMRRRIYKSVVKRKGEKWKRKRKSVNMHLPYEMPNLKGLKMSKGERIHRERGPCPIPNCYRLQAQTYKNGKTYFKRYCHVHKMVYFRLNPDAPINR